MRQPFVALVSLCAFLLCATAHARLGDTREQCEERYGAFLKHDLQLDTALYKHAGWLIDITYVGDIAGRVSYRREAPPLPLSEDVCKAILERNGTLALWKKVDASHWIRTDGAQAILSPDLTQIEIISKAYARATGKMPAGKKGEPAAAVPVEVP